MQRGSEHRILGQRGDDDGGFSGAFDVPPRGTPQPASVAACASIEALNSRRTGMEVVHGRLAGDASV